MMMKLSDFFYTHRGSVPVSLIIRSAYITKYLNPFKYIRVLLRGKRLLNLLKKSIDPIIYIIKPFFRYPPTIPPKYKKTKDLNVLIAGGYGNSNTGDEAQLGATISHWKRLCPNVKLTILSPDPEYTKKEHGEHSEMAPRVTLFDANKSGDYGSSNFWFKWRFRWIKPHMLFLARLYHKGLPLVGAYRHEVHLINLIANADVLHLSGGGYLTGMTLSRLWENMLIIRIADILGTPVILSGQTIGVFKDDMSKKLACWGLKKAKLIYLRDPEGSIADIHSLGIKGPHIKATFDDALFCEMSDKKNIDKCLEKNGINVNEKYAVVNAHYWGQKESDSRQIMKRLAEVCDCIASKYNLQIVFIPMHPSDVPAMEEVQMNMSKNSRIIDYNYDFRITKGVISRAEICIPMKHHTIIFAMGTEVPTISIALDGYYFRKNEGALKLFGQEEWIVNHDSLFSSDILEKKIDDCLTKSWEIKETILSYLKEYKPQDGEVIQRFIEECDIKNEEK
jgi:polysaccharide pyruvyl transferase WcaK-like protein